ncbi:hypothetical protein [Pedobacter caeni]|uniref:Uncharacterized protein n=1 Tax=Pedobacter caeni TaxID=288992 RepID=A0A1M4TNX8_9SPHI|nr:hypothetical protein [Pedobacter caeni]SHE46202.1 hypothetical protein SAMN04488522_101265 [Pedobacter caeni]
MIGFKLSILIIASTLLLSCSDNDNKSSNARTAVQTQPASSASADYSLAEPGVQSSSFLPTRHEETMTKEKKYNPDGSVTVTTITTDGLETKKTEETLFPNVDASSGITNEKQYITDNFSEAHDYARKAYLNATDVENANDYLKKAMSYFEDAESDANEVDCDDAQSSAADGYSYAKKGYNETDPGEIERYAKKAMNEAEEGKNSMEECQRKNQM